MALGKASGGTPAWARALDSSRRASAAQTRREKSRSEWTRLTAAASTSAEPDERRCQHAGHARALPRRLVGIGLGEALLGALQRLGQLYTGDLELCWAEAAHLLECR